MNFGKIKFRIFAIFYLFFCAFIIFVSCNEKDCSVENEEECETPRKSHMHEAVQHKWDKYLAQIKAALAAYEPCGQSKNSSCYLDVIKRDLEPFRKIGISKDLIDAAAVKGTKYQIIDGKIYRHKDCMFPARCSGIEHFLQKIASKIPNIDLVINTRDWPQVAKQFSTQIPVFSFSKTLDYYDIMYPAWAFWEGGPAIRLYPRGLGQWGEHRASLTEASRRWPWEAKDTKAFFRGSRTSAERDPLVLLSRERPDLADAKYTKNQAWKSDADTLNEAPAEEVRLEDHCQYRYLFNFRGVAASFRLKHLFLCDSLVIHVGEEWLEFFYSALKPWVHYLPLPAAASKEQIRELLEFAQENDSVVREIAERGSKFVTEHLRLKDIEAFWLRLLRRYAKLLTYTVTRDTDLQPIN